MAPSAPVVGVSKLFSGEGRTWLGKRGKGGRDRGKESGARDQEDRSEEVIRVVEALTEEGKDGGDDADKE